MSANTHNELTLKFFESARTELVERIRLRDQTLIVYVGAVGAYFAFAASEHFGIGRTPGNPREWDTLDVLLTIPLPFVCLIGTLILLNHHRLIGQLGAYVAQLQFKSDDGVTPPETVSWNVWRMNRGPGRKADTRFWAQLLVLLLPLAYSIFVNASILTGVYTDPLTIGPWLSLGVDVVVTVIVVREHIKVKRDRDRHGRPKPAEPADG